MMIHRAASLELPPLRALQAFEAVARCGSVTEAALQLGVSPGAVSQQLRKLEQALAVRLLERSGNGMALTSWGSLYHAELGPAFAQLRSAQEKLWRARTQDALVLSCLLSVASRWIGPRLFDWKASHPASKVRLLGAEAEPRPGDEAVDFRITYGRAAGGFAHQAELFTDRVVPACAPELLAAHRLRKPSDLLDLPLIGIEWELRHGALPSWREWAESVGAQRSWPAGELSFSMSSAAIDAAVNRRGVVMAQVSLIADDLASGRLVVPFDRRLALAEPYFLAWDRAALQKPFGTEFRAWVIALARRQAKLSTAALPAPAPARGKRAQP